MTTDQQKSCAEMPIELHGVREVLESAEGFWRACSGCYESEDGHPVGHYPHSHIFGCDLGSGCSECGGIGAVWDDTDYDAMAAAGDADEIAREQLEGAPTIADVRETAALSLLRTLVELKNRKNRLGKDEFYETNQPLAWERARALLSATPTPAAAQERPVEPDDIDAVAEAVQRETGVDWEQAQRGAVAAIDTLIARGNHIPAAAITQGEPIYQVRQKGSLKWQDLEKISFDMYTDEERYVRRIVYPSQPTSSKGMPDSCGAALPAMPEHVLSDIQAATKYMEMWARGEAFYAPKNGYDEPGIKAATIADVKKTAAYIAPRLRASSIALQDYFAEIDLIAAKPVSVVAQAAAADVPSTSHRVQVDPCAAPLTIAPLGFRHCQSGNKDVCRAGQRDGVVCPEDSCDIDDGQRAADTAASGLADYELTQSEDTALARLRNLAQPGWYPELKPLIGAVERLHKLSARFAMPERKAVTDDPRVGTYQHVKTRGMYDLIAVGKIESSSESVAIYWSWFTGQMWVRPESEFFDGRFVKKTPPIESTGEPHA
ncbi:hypothetical protein QYH69_32380 [Paraburkholderia sp. SARCC-3016]|uniref:hypothetical protein n=1 Tax=Paraburkholderia sp. SARCC-3016 TaxID=3058611 RepID=UPI0028088937|nr:hypothetical protein [Paraburkholderia sp. SARCC-3016]MDQ7981922.1 hypothetical protein [Paraburkholderia sp. SARCC-3016]